jgi:hypothetical protein
MSVLGDNLEALGKRFPALAEEIRTAGPSPSLEISPSRSGKPSAVLDGRRLHSAYDPSVEAARLVAALPDSDTCVFYGFGLAYLPEAYLGAAPGRLAVVVEPDIALMKGALSARALGALLSDERLSLVVAAPPESLVHVLDELGSRDIASLALAGETARESDYFSACEELSRRFSEKSKINENTLKRFGGLWVRNLARNWEKAAGLPGLAPLSGALSGLPALILAAGPSLDAILPLLPGLARRMVVIAVDTAALAAQDAGVAPDFVLLVDPQYWNSRHLDGVDPRRSVLVAESAAHPSALRKPWRAAFLCSSLFPLGQFMEERLGDRGRLGAGGSVSTTAWDFARVAGASPLYFAGLDLGYPGKATHAANSLFERRSLHDAKRLATAETASLSAILSAGPCLVQDNSGGKVLTDKRMLLYLWWFESRMARHPELPTYTLSPGGAAIPGMPFRSVGGLLGLPPLREAIDDRIKGILEAARPPERAAAARAKAELLSCLDSMDKTSGRAMEAAEGAVKARAQGKDIRKWLERLEACDAEMLGNPAREVVSFLFAIAGRGEGEEEGDPLAATLAVYGRAREAAAYHLARLGATGGFIVRA